MIILFIYEINNTIIYFMNSVILSLDPIEPYKLLKKFQDTSCNLSLSGGQSVFIGYMRETNQSRGDVISMKLDYYPNMTKRYLINLGEKIKKDYKLHNVLIAHRVGDVFPDDCLVIVACWSKHRKSSIDAVKVILEDLKHNAPLWKKESFSDNTSKWVEVNT